MYKVSFFVFLTRAVRQILRCRTSADPLSDQLCLNLCEAPNGYGIEGLAVVFSNSRTNGQTQHACAQRCLKKLSRIVQPINKWEQYNSPSGHKCTAVIVDCFYVLFFGQ